MPRTLAWPGRPGNGRLTCGARQTRMICCRAIGPSRGSGRRTDTSWRSHGNVEPVPVPAARRANPVEGRGPDHHRLHVGVRGRQRDLLASTPRASSSSGTPPSGSTGRWTSTPRTPWGSTTGPIAIYGSDLWNRLTARSRAHVRRHLQAHTLSQFMHGEQGALIATAKIVQTVPGIDAKFYAATQVMDEARHVEAYARLLHEKFELAYPITPTLALLLESTITDSRWDMTYLGMQVLIEGLALAAFQRIRDTSSNTLAAARERLRHAGRGAPRGLRPPRPARLLPAAHRGRAGRARGVRGRGLLSHARPLQPGRGVGEPRAARQGVRGGRREVRVHEACSARGSSRESSPPSRTSASGARACGRRTRTWASWGSPRWTPWPCSTTTAAWPRSSTPRCSSRRPSARQ